MSSGSTSGLGDEDFARLLAFRDGLRQFLHWSEAQAKAVGLTAAQHQLLLAVRGHGGDAPPSIGEIADHLLLRHHSAVGLIDRAEAAGLVARGPDADNGSAVRLRLTEGGARQLEALSELHVEELAHLAPTMHALWDALERAGDGHPAARQPPTA
jgi:DNA-binding MarR family transcriptional regulator